MQSENILPAENVAHGIAVSRNSAHTCANCEATAPGAYCSACGQPKDTHRRSVLGLVHSFIEDVISFDSRILRTIVALLVEPGEMAIAFREGRTMRYVPPLRLYFFVSLLFFLLLSVTHLAILQLEVTATPMKITYDDKGNAFVTNPAYDANDADTKFLPKIIPVGKAGSGRFVNRYAFATKAHFFSRIGIYHPTLSKDARDRLNNITDSTDAAMVEIGKDKTLTAKQRKTVAEKQRMADGWIKNYLESGIQRLANDPAALNEPLTTWIPRALFLLMPLYALLLAAFYWRQRRKYYFVDHLIFSLGIHTFLFVVLMADAGLAQFLSGETVGWLTIIVLAIYIFVAIKRFYAQGWVITAAKYVAISFVYTAFFLFPAVLSVFLISFFGGSIG